jgi:photosystem II stability/assembly factor-like uncharacterized protein
MKILIRFIVFILLLSGCRKEKLHLQKVERVETNTASRMNRLAIINDSIYIIGGGEKFSRAEVLYSSNSGNTWQLLSFPDIGKGLYGLGVSPSGEVYLSGFDGKVLHTADQGRSWTAKQIGNWKYHIACAFPSDNRGIFLATEAYKGGYIVQVDKDLNVLGTKSFEFGLNDILFPIPQTGYISGYGAILKSTDSGKNWSYLDIKNDNFTALYALSENELWVCGYGGSIFRTTNGGSTWEKQRNGNSIFIPKYRLLDILFLDQNHGWCVGEEGLVIYTDDGGKNWKEYNRFTGSALRSIAETPDGNLLTTGDNGVLYKLYVR